MNENEFVKNDKDAIIGSVVGIFGGTIIQTIFIILFSAITTIVLNLTLEVSDSAIIYDKISAITSTSWFLGLLTLVSSLLIFLFFIVKIKPKKIIQIFKNIFQPKTLKYALMGVGAILAFSFIYNTITIDLFNLDQGGNANQELVVSIIMHAPIMAFLSIVILAPIIEEFTYRYSFFGGILKRNKVAAYVLSAFAFMLMHLLSSFIQYSGDELFKQLITAPPYAFSGLVLCYLYDKTGRLGSSILAHVLNNTVGYVIIIISIFL